MLGSDEHLTNRGLPVEVPKTPGVASRSDSGDEAYESLRDPIGKRKSSAKASSGWGTYYTPNIRRG